MNSIKYEQGSTSSYTLFNRVTSGIRSYDRDLYSLLHKYSDHIAIAGGALRSIISKTSVNDIDLYITDEDVIPNIIEHLQDTYQVVANTDNAITLKHLDKDKIIQIIKKVLLDPTDPTALFDEFDFTITCSLFYKNALYLGETFLEDLASKTLIIQNKHLQFPIATLIRTQKYQRYGFKVSSMLLVNLALQIHALDINTYADLKAQLQGIDTTIFDAMLQDTDKLTFTVPDMLNYMSENYFNYLEN